MSTFPKSIYAQGQTSQMAWSAGGVFQMKRLQNLLNFKL